MPAPGVTGSANLETLHFDNLQLRVLPVHVNAEPKTPQEISGACFSRATPSPLENPVLVVSSKDALALLGLSEEQQARADAAAYFCGNKVLPGAEPAAHCYCGHQFGNFAGQLGDGATMYLGEVLNPLSERWEIQLKGAGLTNYSRTADGRKVLRSSLREFLASEAMHALGLPTTRAGAIVTSDTRVERDLLYNGNVKLERASVVLRIAHSFLRFGSFEICKPTDATTGRAGPSVGQHHLLERLLDHVSALLQPQLAGKSQKTRWLATFEEIVSRTAVLVAGWQTVGFCHGVLNTDNMAVTGEAIDYGPFGYMEIYEPNFICNMSDNGGRYSYKDQPKICKWNCGKLAEAIAPVLPLESTRPVLARFDRLFEAHYAALMRRKLGLTSERADDAELFRKLFDTMERTGADFTHTFRKLAHHADVHTDPKALVPLRDAIMGRCASPEQMAQLQEQRARSFKPSVPKAQLLQMVHMAQRDPSFLRAFGSNPSLVKAELLEELAKAEKAEALLSRACELRKLSTADKTVADTHLWDTWLQEYNVRVLLEVEIPSEGNISTHEAFGMERKQEMLSCNPRVVLHNWVAQEAIDAAERHDYSHVEQILAVITKPYDEADDHYGCGPPDPLTASYCVS
mmetsp:Transcript_62472/g.103937  ORF Transcript_62472/g.103937 Transcript_62472/m.103937 type:complete len:630 (-) Transcript_62472:410-2299(-)|eukprot:CAMPEP_0119310064 /NCGR_PEP_ID=MMETSP1333-20130426/17680_1 /TAXON_ID=418940 /ORGANISM="Scyphosphaera apsteinii, Strain RCC1455" /LENGTH=629 /DNA_ID=CAMNT_0007314181 /DNA_START=35 /DNA_END=1924 /DNA_ORIENTATION=-